MERKKVKYSKTIADIIKENERLIKFAKVFTIVYSIIYIILIIAWIYFKNIGN